MKNKTIMFIEDNAYINHHTVNMLNEQLISKGYVVKGFHRIDQANSYIKKVADGEIVDEEICCIVTDLNMNDSWFENNFKSETHGGMFSGWVWLKHYVFNNPKLNNPHIIIYSGYTDDLKEILGSDDLKERNIAIVRKGGNDNEGIKGLYKEISNALNI